MFKVKPILVTIFAAGFLALHFLYLHNYVPLVAVDMFFLIVSSVGYFYPNRISYLIVGVSWLAVYPVYVVLYRIDPVHAALTLLVFNGLLLVFAGYRNIAGREKKLWNRKISEKDAVRDELAAAYADVLKAEENIRARELAIINLYEITKKMSEDLRFDDIFAAFSSFLKDNFVFRKCALLVLKRGDDGLSVDREYVVWQKDAIIGKNAGGKPGLDKLAGMFMKGFRDIYIAKSEHPHLFTEIGIDDPAVETLVAIPLLSEKKVVGLLVIENFPKTDVERLIIVSMQFALEIKKVLLYEMVERMAITDSLTGLYLRRHFYERLTEELVRSKRFNFDLSFLMIDIDDFKKCNDTYGHLVGDVVLKEVARVIRENIREIDIVARYGGEEISLALPETGVESARIVAERVRRKIEENLFKAYDEKVRITVSIGMAAYPKDSGDMKALIEKADIALYAAKKSGKNVVCEYKK